MIMIMMMITMIMIITTFISSTPDVNAQGKHSHACRYHSGPYS